MVEVDQLVNNVLESGAIRVIVTGGEPTMHDLGPLTAALKQRNIKTHIETSGVHALTGQWDWITFSPKKLFINRICPSNLRVIGKCTLQASNL